MTTVITKAMNIGDNIIVFFDEDISKHNRKVAKTDIGTVEILSIENGRNHSYSAIVKTNIPLDKMKNLAVTF